VRGRELCVGVCEFWVASQESTGMREAMEWLAFLRPHSGSTIWLNSLHVGLLVSTEMVDLQKLRFNENMLMAMPWELPAQGWFTRDLAGSGCILTHTPQLQPTQVVADIQEAVQDILIFDVLARKETGLLPRTSWLVWMANSAQAARLCVSCEAFSGSGGSLWGHWNQTTLMWKAGQAVSPVPSLGFIVLPPQGPGPYQPTGRLLIRSDALPRGFSFPPHLCGLGGLLMGLSSWLVDDPFSAPSLLSLRQRAEICGDTEVREGVFRAIQAIQLDGTADVGAHVSLQTILRMSGTDVLSLTAVYSSNGQTILEILGEEEDRAGAVVDINVLKAKIRRAKTLLWPEGEHLHSCKMPPALCLSLLKSLTEASSSPDYPAWLQMSLQPASAILLPGIMYGHTATPCLHCAVHNWRENPG
jgi:hypothetical protein